MVQFTRRHAVVVIVSSVSKAADYDALGIRCTMLSAQCGNLVFSQFREQPKCNSSFFSPRLNL